ncbi:unnamed protein product [Protopolystoma xenopodis]|uniref:Uncharacterized protein n=1 Tax=Protopolystoma xenopodis TaxID=117903 RepID=A0A3S5AH18_9PLAT|nr:unnamed protein product [Protopolystoma xenopodis]
MIDIGAKLDELLTFLRPTSHDSDANAVVLTNSCKVLSSSPSENCDRDTYFVGNQHYKPLNSINDTISTSGSVSMHNKNALNGEDEESGDQQLGLPWQPASLIERSNLLKADSIRRSGNISTVNVNNTYLPPYPFSPPATSSYSSISSSSSSTTSSISPSGSTLERLHQNAKSYAKSSISDDFLKIHSYNTAPNLSEVRHSTPSLEAKHENAGKCLALDMSGDIVVEQDTDLGLNLKSERQPFLALTEVECLRKSFC